METSYYRRILSDDNYNNDYFGRDTSYITTNAILLSKQLKAPFFD
jgi:hypothetical protein